MISKKFRNPKTNLKIELEVFLEIEKVSKSKSKALFKIKKVRQHW
jgi:hypothetical protein